MGVDIVLRELNSAVYDWDAEEKVFQQDNTNYGQVTVETWRAHPHAPTSGGSVRRASLASYSNPWQLGRR